MSTLYLLQYNNYYNRIVKKYDTLSDYLTNIPANRRYTLTNINFFYNDLVNTTQTINYKAPEQIPEGYFDYLLVDNDNYGLSRWFIIECKWNRQGQQILTLRRDLLVDFMSSYLTQPLFAEKGTILSGTSALMPLISNPEDVSVSQILQSKTNLDESNRAIVGYIDRTYDAGDIALDANAIYLDSLELLDLPDTMTIEGPRSGYSHIIRIGIVDSTTISSSTGAEYRYNIGPGTITTAGYTPWANNGVSVFGTDASSPTLTVLEALRPLTNAIYHDMSKDLDVGNYYRLLSYINKPIMCRGIIYKLTATSTESEITPNVSDGVWDSIEANIRTSPTMYIHYPEEGRAAPQRGNIKYSVYTTKYTLSLAVDTQTSKLTLKDVATRTHCGQPYDIFYMADSTTARQIASIIASRLYGSGALYDLQLLPYAPSITGASQLTISYSGSSVVMYWIKNIDATYDCSDYSKSYSNSTEYKVGCLCDTVRICSPNHANSWDFNPAQNGGVTGFNIRCTFKPFAPYIHIKPVFKWMYGTAYTTDPRGLICSGSFSFPFVNDKWATYQANNSAYFNSFEREIENLSLTQDVDRKREDLNIALRSAGNAASVLTGNPLGILSAATSTISMLENRELNEMLRNEAMDYRHDMFGFHNQNIMAAPKTLGKTDSFDIDWNGPAYVEYYSASAGEKEAIQNKLKYNGWSLNVIVKPSNTSWFTNGIKTLLNNAKTGQSNYVKGKLIYTTLYDDTHIFNELANEWYKGFYWDSSNGELT